MNRIAGRAAITVLLALLLIGGFAFFVAEYVTQANEWVLFTGSPHIYNGINIGTGTVLDRDGVLATGLSTDVLNERDLTALYGTELKLFYEERLGRDVCAAPQFTI